ncbi:MAG: hypothetical protein K9L02_03305 [Acholeplasmataceae bacterium]|nr:hypothetical protein [Acholeplasmataceae bacterium]
MLYSYYYGGFKYEIRDIALKKIHNALVENNIISEDLEKYKFIDEEKMHGSYPSLITLDSKILNVIVIEKIQWYKKNTVFTKNQLSLLIEDIRKKKGINDFVVIKILTGYGSKTSYSRLKNIVIDTIKDYKETYQIDYLSFPLEECDSINKGLYCNKLEDLDKSIYFKNSGIVYTIVY